MNFTVLHSLLHVIVKQLDLVETNVEFRGSDSERLQNYIANAKPGPLLTLTEYTIGEEGPEKEGRSKYKRGIHGTVSGEVFVRTKELRSIFHIYSIFFTLH